MKNLVLPLILILLVTGCTKSRQGNKTQQSAQSAPAEQERNSSSNLLRIQPEMLRDLRITTSQVEERSGADGVNLLGEVTVNEGAYAQVGPPIAGRIVSIIATPGQQVKKGQLLAIMQSTELGKARSDAISAQAHLELAQRILERKRRLASEKIVAEREVQEAEASSASAEAELRASRATLRALGAGDVVSDSSELALRAPVSGTVIERTAIQGQMAEPSQTLFRIGDLSTLWVVVHAFERDAVRVQLASPAKVTFPALPGKEFPGKVALIGKQVDMQSRTLPVRIDLKNSEGLLRPGMSANAWVPLGSKSEKVLTVPAASVQRLEEDWYVFIPRSENTFEMRKVGRGRDLGGEVEIVGGLEAKETVVVDGAFLLKAEAEKARGEGEHDHD